jgi:hypothetical protein
MKHFELAQRLAQRAFVISVLPVVACPLELAQA